MAGKIFINYRREDAIATAGRMHDRLAKAFGRKQLFMDVDHIPAGVDFVAYLEKQVAKCDVLIAVMGPTWLNAKGPDGLRRLDNVEDFVVIEIATALARNVRVIPVLVDGARMPRADELPEPLKPLARRNAVTLQNSQFGSDAERLVEKIREAMAGEAPDTGRTRWPSIAAAVVVAIAGGLGYLTYKRFGLDVDGWVAGLEAPQIGQAPRTESSVDDAGKKLAAEREEGFRRLAEEAKKRAADLAAPQKEKVATEDAGPSKSADPLVPAEPSSWSLPGGNYAGHRYSPLSQINKSNVGNLRVAWSFSTGVLRGHEGNPLVIGSKMYLATPFPNNVFALDLDEDGAVLWKYQPRQDPSVIPVMCCDTVNRGVIHSGGRIYLHQADTTLVALDAATGREVWKAVNGDPRKGETGTSAPIAIKDKIIVGISGGEFGLRGHVTAYDSNTGRRMWRAYSTGPDSDILMDPDRTTSLGKPIGRDSSLKTWTGDQWKIGGGTAWGWLSYDADLNLFYYGTGNPSTWNPSQREGPDGKQIDQKWTTSIIARNPDTGIAAWAYQMTPFDEWSYDGVNEMVLADLDFGGRKRKALVHFDKNGLAYTLDRAIGELLVAAKFDPTVNWTTGVELDRNEPNYGRPLVVASKSTFLNGADVNTKDVCPSSAGAKSQGPAAFSSRSQLFYASTTHLCMDYEPFKVSFTPGQPYVGATLSMFPPQGETQRGNFIAWDAVRGKIVWSKPESFAVWSGALATAGDVVFYGTLEGYLKAVDAATGKELFKYKNASGIVGNVMTYAHKGKQYVAVFSGVGGWAGIALAAGLTKPTDGLGMVGAHADLPRHTSLGGQVVVFSLP
jgi:PQQ-dependent dehydrogenase (methanol/ethanol family)